MIGYEENRVGNPTVVERSDSPCLTLFDKICGVGAFLLGIALAILGIFGAFIGCNANFTLPPILGALPLLVGWGICKPIYVAWKASSSINR